MKSSITEDLIDAKMNNTEKGEFHNKATRTVIDAAMLLLMRRMLRDAVTF